MGEDLVDRILKKREEDRKARELHQRIALENSAALTENAPALWRALADSIQSLVEKYNKRLNGSFCFSRSDDAQTPHLEVRHEVFPVISLFVVQKAPRLMEFSIERMESSFAPSVGAHGRIEVRADMHHNLIINVHAPNEQKKFLQADDLAEYLLEPVLS